MARKIHLICHAHIDPVWLWTWEEGLTEALSTFRIAAEFCERYRDFVFCHNESLLYRWVEEHDPELFRRVRRLVRSGRWHIMGGAYLQPDINLPSGESHIRQFLYGTRYFGEKFGVRPRSAWNIDSFGQAEGFPQILSGCGIEAYLFSRPRPTSVQLPPGPFRWRDRSGAEVLAQRYDGGYNTRGTVKRKLAEWLASSPSDSELIFLWGFGNHGGGPSRREYRDLVGCMRKRPELRHSNPEAYFARFAGRSAELPVITGELQNASPGCYTSMTTVKRAHREAESLLAGAERLATLAWWRGASDYPKSEVDQAWRQILFAEFHDVLTGTCIPQAEQDTLASLCLCSETVKRFRTRSLLRVLRGEAPAAPNKVPVFVFNPHAFPVETDLEFSFTYSHTNYPLNTIAFTAAADGRSVPVQRERGLLNPEVDWNLQACCYLRLPPLGMKRLDMTWRRLKASRPPAHPKATARRLRFRTKHLEIVINPRTGLVDRAGPAGAGRSFLAPRALRPAVFRDTSHSWKCGTPTEEARAEARLFGTLVSPPWMGPDDYFRLASRREAAGICAPPGGRREVDPIRIIEDGPVRTVVEAIFIYGRSAIVRWYIVSRNLPVLEVRDRVVWNERSTMLKLELPLGFAPGATVSETPCSAAVRPVPKPHIEQVNQRWVKVLEKGGPRWVGVANTASYAHSVHGRKAYVNVLRSPPYGAGWMKAEMPEFEDRCLLRQDQGVHLAAFGLLFGSGGSDLPMVRSAGTMNVRPVWLSHHPAGPARADRATRLPAAVEVTAPNVEVTALKRSEDGRSLVIRLMEHEGRRTGCQVVLRRPDGKKRIAIGPYRLMTLLVRRAGGRLVFREANLVEEEE